MVRFGWVACSNTRTTSSNYPRQAPATISGTKPDTTVTSGVDDYTSQPTGNSGERIGCGLISIQMKN
jgi:Cu/Zn superoxide dismutase